MLVSEFAYDAAGGCNANTICSSSFTGVQSVACCRPVQMHRQVPKT